jgi:hypothetical protein
MNLRHRLLGVVGALAIAFATYGVPLTADAAHPAGGLVEIAARKCGSGQHFPPVTVT